MSSSPDALPVNTSHPSTESLQGIVERVTFHAPDSGYTVVRFNAVGIRDCHGSLCDAQRRICLLDDPVYEQLVQAGLFPQSAGCSGRRRFAPAAAAVA